MAAAIPWVNMGEICASLDNTLNRSRENAVAIRFNERRRYRVGREAGKPASYSEVLCAVVDLSVFFLYIPWRQDSGKSRRRYVWLARRWRSGPGPFRERRTGSRTSRESGATLLSFRWSGPRSWRGRNFLRRRKWPPTKRRFSSGPVARDRWR